MNNPISLKDAAPHRQYNITAIIAFFRRECDIERNIMRLEAALDSFDKLDNEEKELFLDITKKRMSENRRREIKKNADNTLEAVREKRARFGDVDDLLADMES